MARSRKRADNRYVKTRRVDGHRIYGYGATEKAANADLDRKIDAYRNGAYKKSTELTLDEYYKKWSLHRHGVVKEATLRKQQLQYEAISAFHIDKTGKTFGSMKVVDIEVQNVRDLQTNMGKEKRKNGKPRFNTNSINDAIHLLRHIFGDAMNLDRIISFNPATGVKDLKRTEEEARDTTHRALSLQETELFFATADELHSWYCNLYRFLLSSGLRIGEAGALTAADIRQNFIHVERTITIDEVGALQIGTSTKTKKGQRQVPLMPQARLAVSNQKRLNDITFGHDVIALHELIFRSEVNTILNGSNVNRDIRRICKKAGIEVFTAHAFRDTFATRAIESGMNPKTLQEILGHKDISITMNLYAHVMPETKINEMQAVKVGL